MDSPGNASTGCMPGGCSSNRASRCSAAGSHGWEASAQPSYRTRASPAGFLPLTFYEQPLDETFPIDDGPLVGAITNQLQVVPRLELKSHPPAFNCADLGVQADFLSHQRGGLVTDLHGDADAGQVIRQSVFQH